SHCELSGNVEKSAIVGAWLAGGMTGEGAREGALYVSVAGAAVVLCAEPARERPCHRSCSRGSGEVLVAGRAPAIERSFVVATGLNAKHGARAVFEVPSTSFVGRESGCTGDLLDLRLRAFRCLDHVPADPAQVEPLIQGHVGQPSSSRSSRHHDPV